MKGAVDVSSGLNIGDLKILARELYTPDSFAAYGEGSRFNGYHNPDSDVDMVIVTRGTLGLKYVRTDDFPTQVNITYMPREALQSFSTRRRTGLPFKVQPLDEDEYVAALAFGTKEELTRIKLSTYHTRASDAAVPLLLPIASHMVEKPVFDYYMTPTWIRAMRSGPTADILREEYRPVFDSLVEQGVLTKESSDNYVINPNRFSDSTALRDSLFGYLRDTFKLLESRLLKRDKLLLNPGVLKLVISLGRDLIAGSLPENRKTLKQLANDFIRIPEYFS